MIPVRTEQLVTLLIDSKIVSETVAQRLAAEYHAEHESARPESSIQAFSQRLVNGGHVTDWQISKLLAGKWKGFYLDGYLLLEQVGKDFYSSTYKARDVRDGEIVCLVFTPVNQTGGRIEYKVQPYSES